jgi:lipoprotein-releasing system ATP-binding protein
MSTLITAKDLTRILPLEIPVTLVQDINMTINKGEFISVTGPSGSGKSSLLYLLGLLDRPTEGEVSIDGINTSSLSSHELCAIRLGKLGFVFQFHFLLAEFTILENVMVPMQRLGKWTAAERKEKAAHLLESLGLSEHIDKHPSGLSGGQRQRVAIARAMANEPLVILADEPTGNLDSKSSRNVHDIFYKLVEDHMTSIIMVTHDMELAADTHRNIHLVDGKISSKKVRENMAG